MNIDQLKEMLKVSMKNGQTKERDIYRMVISEYEREASKGNQPNISNIVKKLIKSNEECISYNKPNRLELMTENEILGNMLPKELSASELALQIPESVLQSARMAPNQNASVGILMKFIKQNQLITNIESVRSLLDVATIS